MSETTQHISPDLARAARALTQVSVKVIAAAADLEKTAVKAFERGVGPLTAQENRRLKAALEQYGALFIPEDKAHGYGVRQKFSSVKVAKLESWENEGGPAFSDDV